MFRPIILARLAALEISISEAARRAELTGPQLSEFLRGNREMRSDCLERLMGVLGVTLSANAPRHRPSTRH